MIIVAVEISPAIDAVGTLQTFYLSNQKFITNASSTPASTNFEPTIIDPGTIEMSVFSNGETFGDTKLGVGEIVLSNVDGRYDAFFDYGFDRRSIVIRYVDTDVVGTDPTYPGSFTSLFSGIMDTIVGAASTINIRVLDKHSIFDHPYLTEKYAGTNVGAVGIEGTASDIGGTLKARALGTVNNVTAVLVNASNLVYRITNSGSVASNGFYVRDKGAGLTSGSVYETSDDLVAAAVSAGTYAECQNEGLIRLGSLPAGLVTTDFAELYPDNHVSYPTNLENAVWTASGLAVAPRTVLSPEENLTGATLTATAGASTKTVSQTGQARTANVYSTHSIYIKKGTHPYVYLTAYKSANNWASAVFNLTTLTVTQTGVGATSGAIDHTSIVDDGYGWILISLCAAVNVANVDYYLGLAGAATGNTFDTTGKISWTAAGTETVYVWMARVDPGRRTTQWREIWTPLHTGNWLFYSNAFDNAAWVKTNATVTADVKHRFDIATFPLDADQVDNTVAGSLVQTVTGLNPGDIYNMTVAVRRGANNTTFQMHDGTNWSITVNLNTQVVTATSGTYYITSFVSRYNSDWVNLSVTFAASATSCAVTLDIGAPSSGTGTLYLTNSTFGQGPSELYHSTTTNTQILGRGWIQYIDSVLRHMALVGGLKPSEINLNDTYKLSFNGPPPIGHYVQDSSTILQLMAAFVEGTNIFFYFDFSGQFRCGYWTAPEVETPTLYFSTDTMGSDYDRRSLRNTPVPVYRVTVNYYEIYTVQTTDLAGGVTAANRAFYASQWRTVLAEDASVKRKHPDAGEIFLNGLHKAVSYATTAATDRLALLGVRRDLIEFGCPIQPVNLGQVINVTLPRFGMQAGKNMRIQDIKYELKTGRMRITCWG
jgi:hypothetical protein